MPRDSRIAIREQMILFGVLSFCVLYGMWMAHQAIEPAG